MSVTTSPDGSKSYFTTTNTFEVKFGYHRAIRKGPFIFVSGTTALNPKSGKIEYPGDAKLQAQTAMETCVEAVEKLGGKKADVVRVRMFVSKDTGAVGEAFRHCFGQDRENKSMGCAATMIVVKEGFVDLDMLVEVEVDAVV